MKTAISVPGEALERVGRLARRLLENWSQHTSETFDDRVAHHDPISVSCRRSSEEALKHRALGRVATALLILGITGIPASADVTAVDQEVIERILALRSEAARLEMGLTPEARAELERRLKEAEQKPQVEARPSPTVATPPSEVSPRVEQEPTPATRGQCNAFAVFDTNNDGFINATDRYWRYLFLWRDHNQDGRMTDKEVENPFDLEISGLRVDLRFFTKKNGSFGDVRKGEYIVFEHVSSSGVSRGNLVVDASRIKRSDGPQILDASGSVLDGFQALRTGMAMLADGEKLLFHCP